MIALFDLTRHSLASGSAAEDKDSMETDDCPRPRHKDQRDGVRNISRPSDSTQTILRAATTLGEDGRCEPEEPRALWAQGFEGSTWRGMAPSHFSITSQAGMAGQEDWTMKGVMLQGSILCGLDPWLV